MINLKKASLLATVSLMLAPVSAFAEVNQHVVHDSNGNIVHNTFNNCVYSTFEANSPECGEIAKISEEMLKVYFDFNKSTLNAKEKAKLDKVAKLLLAAKSVESIDIEGYADAIGKDGYNKKLSAKRAATVKAYLAKKGVKTRKVSIKALGSSKPVTKCDPGMAKAERIACLAEDRRVELKLNMKK